MGCCRILFVSVAIARAKVIQQIEKIAKEVF
jgi:hypothetical protein